MKGVQSLVLLAAVLYAPVRLASQSLNTAAIAKAIGLPGALSGGVYSLGMPRTDLHVTVQGVVLRPGLALGSWAAFAGSDQQAVVMGDLCLLPSEVNPVMKKLRSGGIEVTALHNHLLFENPRVMYLHFLGRGNALRLAQSLRAALAASQTPLQARPAARPESPPAWVSTVEGALGRPGTWHGGVLAVRVPRATAVIEEGMSVPAAMGVAESMNFQAAPESRVAATGDFVLTAGEVNPVISALQQQGILVTAVHSHMLEEEPRLFFLHFWALGPPSAVAEGLRAALAKVRTK